MAVDWKRWLTENDYDDVRTTIEAIEAKWKAAGLKTRRDWWKELAGHPDGRPCVVAGVTLPIIRAIRERQGLPPCDAAIERFPGEAAPTIKPGRWSR